MKKTLLAISFIFCLFTAQIADAQACGNTTSCSAGPNTQYGFPAPGTIPCAEQGVAYSYSIPFKMYSSFDYLGLHSLDSMTIDTVYNLPCGLCWSLNKASRTYAANEVGCLTITGTTNDAVGQYNLRLVLSAYLTGNGGTAIQLSPNTVDAANIKIWMRVGTSGGLCSAVDTSASATNLVASASCPSHNLPGTDCSGGRYHDFIFPTIDSSTVTYSTANGTLAMDIFQPHGDTVTQRPVIILAHGGSFISGTRSDDPTVTLLCKNMAQRGYVTASIDYRLGSTFNMLDSTYALDEMAKAISDARAAIRYFRLDAATNHTYRINPNLIFGGGNSAGSVMFLHIAYIDSINECPSALINAFNNNGGINGNSGNSGYSSQITAAINLAGGLNSPSLISVGDIPSVNFQGDSDAVMPYYCSDFDQGQIGVRLCGLGSLTPYYQTAGINYQNTIYHGAGHVPWDIDTTELIQVDTIIANFLLQFVCTAIQVSPVSVTLGNNQQVCSGTNVQLTATVTNGQSPYTYAWSSTGNTITCNNCQTASAIITQASTFTVTVTDANNSTATASVTYSIGGTGSINISASGPTNFCTGGSVVLSAGAGYASYHWSDGTTTSAITATQSGTYVVTVTTNSGCSSTGSVTVNAASQPASQSIIGQPAITPFQNYTYIVSAASGINYTWVATGGAIQSGQGTNSVSIIWGSTGPYLVTLIQTNAGGCSDTSSLLVINSGCALQIGLNVISSSPICSGDTVLLIASVSGNGATYQWVRNGSQLAGQTSDTLFATNTGNYQVSVTANSCTSLSSVNTVSFAAAPALPIISSNANVNGCNTQPVTLSLNNSYPAYNWSTGDVTSTAVVTSSGSYVVTVTGSNGCRAVSAPYNLNLSIISPVDICIVSVDSATGKNIIIWNNPQLTAIDSFLIYKETNAYNVFDEIGGVKGTDFSTFIDVNSIPAQQADRYKLAVLDSCGHLTLQSSPHQTIHLSINQGIGNTWNLIWNAYQGFVFPSYYIYRGIMGGTLTQIATISSANISYTDLSPPTGTAYYQIGIENPNGCNPSRNSNYSESVSNIVSTAQVGIANITNDNIEMYSFNAGGRNVVKVVNDKASAYGLRLYEISGRLVLDKPGRNTEETVLPESLAKGVYIAEAYFAGGEVKKLKVVVR